MISACLCRVLEFSWFFIIGFACLFLSVVLISGFVFAYEAIDRQGCTSGIYYSILLAILY